MYKIIRYITMLSLISFTSIPICKAMNVNIIPTDTINRTIVDIDNITITKFSPYTLPYTSYIQYIEYKNTPYTSYTSYKQEPYNIINYLSRARIDIDRIGSILKSYVKLNLYSIANITFI
jgi:hypothetical protein